MQLKKYDTFFYLLVPVCFFSSFILYMVIDLPIEHIDMTKLSMSEIINIYYLNGRHWDLKLGIFMLPVGIGIVGIIWLMDLDICVEELYNMLKYRLRSWYIKKRHNT
jgi:hypothetical protein